MKKILKFKTNTLVAYSFLILSLELIFKLLMFHGMSFGSFVYTFLFSLPIILVLSILTNLLPKKAGKIIFYKYHC